MRKNLDLVSDVWHGICVSPPSSHMYIFHQHISVNGKVALPSGTLKIIFSDE